MQNQESSNFLKCETQKMWLKASNFVNAKNSTYSLTGLKKKNKLNILSDYKIWINSLSYNHVEIMHHIILLMSVDILIGKDIYKTNL